MCSFASVVQANENDTDFTLWDDVVWHGFLSQGFVYTDENDFLGSSSNGSFKFNEAALNISWQTLSNLQLSAQALYQQTGNAKPNGLQLDYAIMDWRALDTFDYGGGIRLGRLKSPYGFFNETRDVAATRPSILLPESIYIDYLRALLHSSDSLGVYGHRETESGTFSFTANYGKPILNQDIINTLVQSRTDGDLNRERAGAVRISYDDGSGLWRTALSFVRFDADFEAAAGDHLRGVFDGDVSIEQLLVSMEFNWQNWQLIGEYQLRDYESRAIRGIDIKTNGVGHYFQLAYTFTPTFKAYIRQDNVYQDKKDKRGVVYALQTGLPAHNTFAKDMTLGFNYAPTFEWSFGIEAHHVNGTHWLPNLENRNIFNQKQRWNMYLAQVAYRF